jgi:hypothetical protein
VVANGVPDRSAWEIGRLTSTSVSTRDTLPATETLSTQIEGVRLRRKRVRVSSVNSKVGGVGNALPSLATSRSASW